MTYGDGAFALSGNWENPEIGIQVVCGSQGMPDASVTWTVTAGTGYVGPESFSAPLNSFTGRTDMNGMAHAVFKYPGSSPNLFSSNEPGLVQAASGALTLNYHVTMFNSCPVQGCQTSPPLPPSLQLAPQGGDLGTVRVGDVIDAGITVDVRNSTGFFDINRGVGHIGVRLVEPFNWGDPMVPSTVARCAGTTGTVLSSDAGLATCDVVMIGSATGTQVFMVLVGEAYRWSGRAVVTP